MYPEYSQNCMQPHTYPLYITIPCKKIKYALCACKHSACFTKKTIYIEEKNRSEEGAKIENKVEQYALHALRNASL